MFWLMLQNPLLQDVKVTCAAIGLADINVMSLSDDLSMSSYHQTAAGQKALLYALCMPAMSARGLSVYSFGCSLCMIDCTSPWHATFA